MRTIRSLAVSAALAAILAAFGCAAPVVPIRHALPAAVPLPSDLVGLDAGSFRVKAGPAGDYGARLSQALAERLAKTPLSPGAATGPRARVGGDVVIEVGDAAGHRSIRRRDAKTGQFEPVRAPSLVRTVTARVSFVVTRAGADEPLVTVEVERTYSSLADPRVRGAAGLDRADDPRRVPSPDTVIGELLDECAEAFGGMVRPLTVEAEVPMRPTGQADGAAGLRAAEKGDFALALRHFRAATAAAPKDVGLLLNRAVASEAAGDLPDALEHYQAVVKATKGKDAVAAEAALRVKRVMLHLKPPPR